MHRGEKKRDLKRKMAALLTSALRCMQAMMSWSAAAPRSQRVREGRRVELRRAAPLGDKASSEENGSTGTVSPAKWLDVDLGTVAKQSAAEWFDGQRDMRVLFTQ